MESRYPATAASINLRLVDASGAPNRLRPRRRQIDKFSSSAAAWPNQLAGHDCCTQTGNCKRNLIKISRSKKKAGSAILFRRCSRCLTQYSPFWRTASRQWGVRIVAAGPGEAPPAAAAPPADFLPRRAAPRPRVSAPLTGSARVAARLDLLHRVQHLLATRCNYILSPASAPPRPFLKEKPPPIKGWAQLLACRSSHLESHD